MLAAVVVVAKAVKAREPRAVVGGLVAYVARVAVAVTR